MSELPPLPKAVAWMGQKSMIFWYSPGVGRVSVYKFDDVQAYATAAVLQERERCAKIAENFAAPILIEATSQEHGPEAEMMTEVMRHALYAPLAAAIRAQGG